jgi:hypothetical protein
MIGKWNRRRTTTMTLVLLSLSAMTSRAADAPWPGIVPNFQAAAPAGNAAAVEADTRPRSEGPIPIRFTLDKPGFVTLVVDDDAGKRVRNLLAEEQFAAGGHTVYWDCADGSDVHLHKSNGTLVNPGKYVVRGLVRDDLKLIYEFAVYNPGDPPWGVRDPETGLYYGRWLSDHNPPAGALFLPHGSPAGKQPQLMFSAGGSEWGDGFMWTDLEGRKLHGQRWAGGVFSGAERLTRDRGSQGVAGVYAYSLKGTRTKSKKDPSAKQQFGFRVMAFQQRTERRPGQAPFADVQVLGADRPLAEKNEVPPGVNPVGGLAAWNGLVVVSATCDDQLVIIDAERHHVPKEKGRQEGGSIGEEIGTVDLARPRGLVFNAQGDLFALSDSRLLVFPGAGKTLRERKLPQPRVLVAKGLEDPSDVSLDKAGNLYVSDHGASHQVKVYAPDGTLLRAIGKPGGVRLGPYDEQRMFNPAQVALTDAGEVWVAESHFTPRRISRWKSDGTFVRAYYGPPGYGGGGRVTPDGRSVRYCHGEPWNAQATLEFALDWKAGRGTFRAVTHWLDAPGVNLLRLPGRTGPVNVYDHRGRRYYHNASYLQGGVGDLAIWMQKDGQIVPVAAIGRPNDWKKTLLSDEFAGRLPKGVDPNGRFGGGPPFAWADLNGDGEVQAAEVRWYEPGESGRGQKKMGGITVQDGFVLLASDGRRYEPIEFTPQGAPVYDLNRSTSFVKGGAATENVGMVQLAHDGAAILLGSPLMGWRNGERIWTYPCEWQGVHGSHAAPTPRWGGDINGGMKAPGPLFTPRGGEAGQMWALTSNYGCVHLGTIDGLYVGTVMRDARRAAGWPATVRRGDNVIEFTGGQESFGISLQQLDDGRIIMSVGGEMIGLCRLEGLESVRRLPTQTLSVSAADVEAAFTRHREQAARLKPKDDIVKVRMGDQRRAVTASLDDWKDANWTTIETVRVTVDFGTKPMEMKAALQFCGDRLHAAWLARSSESLVANSIESPHMLFKTGAALDLMLGAVGADPARKTPVVGDLRLLVARTPGPKGAVTAMLYRQKSGHGGTKQTFSSPWRSVEFDDVHDVSTAVEFKESPPIKAQPTDQRLYEVAVPLKELGLQIEDGCTIRGDIGYLRGLPGQTSERVYWHNKVTGLIADVPGEAMLEPAQWGTLEFSRMK